VPTRGTQEKRNEWSTATVECVLPSADKIVRSCFVRTTKGFFIRAVQDLVLLISVLGESGSVTL